MLYCSWSTTDPVTAEESLNKVETDSSPCPMLWPVGRPRFTRRASLHSKHFILKRIPWKMPAQIDSETRAAMLLLHKVNYSSRKIKDTLESTQAPAILLFRDLTSQVTPLALSLMDYSIHRIFKRRFWKRRTRSLQVLLWRVVRHLRGTVCTYFRVLIWSCFRMLDNSSYGIKHSSESIRVVLSIKNELKTVSTLPKHSSVHSGRQKTYNDIMFGQLTDTVIKQRQLYWICQATLSIDALDKYKNMHVRSLPFIKMSSHRKSKIKCSHIYQALSLFF